jgi:ABC-type nitrate/sulfonate/bicarbonate transport system substrate-binding protein
MKIAVPDLVSNSYFPVLAAVELGCFRAEGIDAEIEVIFPPNRTYQALREGAVDLVAGSAHAAVSAFPDWAGVRLICAQSSSMYWFLVMHNDFAAKRGDLSVIKGRRIGAAPWVEMGLRGILEVAGYDAERDGITVGPVPKSPEAGLNFGLSAFRALESRQVDGFWANGLAAELSEQHGVGTIVLDARRGDGPAGSTEFTFAGVAATSRTIGANPDLGGAVTRAIRRAHALLKEDVSRAAAVGSKLFPAEEAALIGTLVARDLPWYDTTITPHQFAAMNEFLRRQAAIANIARFEDVVIVEDRRETFSDG